MAKSPITVLCVDDHLLVREGIEFVIGLEPDIKVVASASSGAEAIRLFRKHRPDVTVMDLRLPDISGLEAIRTIHHESPDARIVVLSAHHGMDDIHSALTAGATSYVFKEMGSAVLIRILREVHAGRRAIPQEVEALYAEHDTNPGLTPRETALLELMAVGMRNKEIAYALGISPLTCQGHIKKIFTKLKVNDRTAAVTLALKRGIIQLKND